MDFFYLLGSVYKPLPDSLDYTVDWFKSGAGVPDPHRGILPSLVTIDVTNFLSAPGKLLLGPLRSNNGEVHENVAEKWTSHPFTVFRDYFKWPAQLLKGREFGVKLKRRDCGRVLKEMVEFIALPLPFPSRLKIRSFHVLVMQGRQRNVQKA